MVLIFFESTRLKISKCFFYTNACQNFMSYLKQSPQNLFISLLQPPNPREDTKQINSPNRPLVPSHSTAVKPPLTLYYLLQFLKVRFVGCLQQNHPQSCQDALAKSTPTQLKCTGNGIQPFTNFLLASYVYRSF